MRCTAFYSHPWAWNEIGFRGPAYPRGYLNPGVNAREKWEVADHHDVDPVPFAARIERARKADDHIIGAAPRVSDYRAVRARNESAWLIPNDGSRVQPPAAPRHAALLRGRRGRRRHRGCRRRRRHADATVVAGGLARRRARRRPVLGSRHRLGQRRARVTRAVLDRAPPDRWLGSGSVGLQQLRARGRRVDGALRGLRAAVSPVGLPHASADGVGADWPIAYRAAAALLRADRGRAARRRAGLAVGRPASLPAQPASGRRQRDGRVARRRATGHPDAGRTGRDPQRPLRQPAALHLSRVLHPGLQGQRQGQPADHPHSRCAGARRRSAAGLPRLTGACRRPHRPRHRRQVLPRRRRQAPAGQRGRRRRLLDRDAAAAAVVGH